MDGRRAAAEVLLQSASGINMTKPNNLPSIMAHAFQATFYTHQKNAPGLPSQDFEDAW